eukprot:757827-Prymnesium_polylepis.1
MSFAGHLPAPCASLLVPMSAPHLRWRMPHDIVRFDTFSCAVLLTKPGRAEYRTERAAWSQTPGTGGGTLYMRRSHR